MPGLLDSVFGIHAEALRIRSMRTQVLASNLANADTPNYKARDIDFRAALDGSATARVRVIRTQPGHLTGTRSNGSVDLIYRTPHQPSLDGNTVSTEAEQAAFGRNAVQYQASLVFINGRIQGLRAALTGGR